MVTAFEQGVKGSKRYSLIDKVQGFSRTNGADRATSAPFSLA
jgi:hypothetical protein